MMHELPTGSKADTTRVSVAELYEAYMKHEA